MLSVSKFNLLFVGPTPQSLLREGIYRRLPNLWLSLITYWHNKPVYRHLKFPFALASYVDESDKIGWSKLSWILRTCSSQFVWICLECLNFWQQSLSSKWDFHRIPKVTKLGRPHAKYQLNKITYHFPIPCLLHTIVMDMKCSPSTLIISQLALSLLVNSCNFVVYLVIYSSVAQTLLNMLNHLQSFSGSESSHGYVILLTCTGR